MGLGEIRLIAARTAGALAVEPASTTTTPSSPIWTAIFPPAPAIMKTLAGRTANTSSASDDALFEVWTAASIGRSRAMSRWTTPSATHAAAESARRPSRRPGASVTAVGPERSTGRRYQRTLEAELWSLVFGLWSLVFGLLVVDLSTLTSSVELRATGY